MKHFEPESGNYRPAHPAVCFTSSRLCGTPELCCGPQIGAAERLGSIPAGTLIGLAPQSKRFFACLICVRLMTQALSAALSAAHAIRQRDRDVDSRPQAQLLKKAPPPRSLAQC